MKIFVAINNQQLGPLEMSEFVTSYSVGRFLDTDLAWAEGEIEWSTVRDFSAKHGISLAASTPPPMPDFAHPREITTANYHSQFFSALGADIRVHIRKCRALERDHWVKWDDGRDEFFELPVEVIPGHEVVVIGMESMPLPDAKVAETPAGESLFKMEATNVSWSLIINPATGEEWSEVSKRVGELKTPYADLVVKLAQRYGNDLGRAEREGSKFGYSTYLVLAPLVADGALGVLGWWLASYFVPVMYAIAIGISIFSLLFIRDSKHNLRADTLDYAKVKERLVSKVKSGLLVQSTLREIEDWVAGIATPYRRAS